MALKFRRGNPHQELAALLSKVQREQAANAAIPPLAAQAPPVAPPVPAPAPVPVSVAPAAPVPASAPAPVAPVPAIAPAPAVNDALTGRVTSIEKSLQSIHELRELSELLSVKYNPFLTAEDEGVAEIELQDLVDAPYRGERDGISIGTAPAPSITIIAPAEAEPAPVVAAPMHATPSPPPVAHTLPAPAPTAPAPALAPVQAPAPATKPAPAAPAARPAPQAPIPVQIVAPVPAVHTPAPAPPPEAPALRKVGGFDDSLFTNKERPAGGARESFLAIHWFTYLSEGTDPSIIYLYLDYYRFVGWLDEESHEWLVRLAEGLSPRKPDATWKDYGMDVKRLAQNHLRNLRFLDKLLGTTLQHGEAQYLQQTVDALLMEE